MTNSLSDQRSFLSVAYSEEEDFLGLLETLAAKELELRVSKGKLFVTPRAGLTEKEEERVRLFKDRIIELIQDDEYKKTGILQCDRQVFDLWREWDKP